MTLHLSQIFLTSAGLHPSSFLTVAPNTAVPGHKNKGLRPEQWWMMRILPVDDATAGSDRTEQLDDDAVGQEDTDMGTAASCR